MLRRSASSRRPALRAASGKMPAPKPLAITARPALGEAPMRSLAEFTKTTLIGGVLVILPVWISMLLLRK